MPKLTSEDQILQRITDAKATKELKDYMYRMRRFLAGDYDSAIYGRSTNLIDSDAGRIYKSNPNWPDFRINRHTEGVSNHTMTWALILMKQSLISKPKFDFPDLPIKTAQVREQLILDRFRFCHWKSHQILMLMSYLVDGLAFIRHGTKKGYSCCRYVDTLDMYWDLHAQTPADFRFLAADLRINEETAVDLFGQDVVNSYFSKNDDRSKKKGERVLKVIEYHDETTKAYMTGGDSKLLLTPKANQFGAVPYTWLCGPMLPSMRSPIPHIINVIGAQTAHSTLQKSLLELERGVRPIYLIQEQHFTPDSVRMFYDKDSDCSGNPQVLRWASRVAPEDKRDAIKIIYVDKIPEQLLEVKHDIESEIIRAMTVNPFTSGSPQDVDFAREISEISAQSEVGSSFIREDLSDALSRIGRMICKVAKFDVAPLRYRSQQGTVLFGGDSAYSIRPIVEEDVECIATAGVYETESMKMLKAEKLLDVIAKTGLGSQYPRLITYAIEQLSEAYGVRDVNGVMSPLDEDELKLRLVQQVPMEVLQEALMVVQQMAVEQQQNSGAAA